MAKYLETKDISYHLQHLVRGSKVHLTLICPYLKIDKKLIEEIDDRSKAGVKIYFVVREGEVKRRELEKINSLSNTVVFVRENLHAKCYLNENSAIITSMNLHEYSAINDDEMGIFISRNDDQKLYEDILAGARRLFSHSHKSIDPLETLSDGFCIRCKKAIKTDYLHPYCTSCFKKWDISGADRTKTEEYCYHCGNPNKSTINKPICWKCWSVHGTMYISPSST